MDPRTRNTNASPTVTRQPQRRREVEHAGLLWLDLVQPAEAEVLALRERFALDTLALESILSTARRPRMIYHPSQEQLFVELHTPVVDREGRVAVSEVAIFAIKDVIITVHDGAIKPLRRAFASASTDETARAQLMGRGLGYLLYRLLDASLRQGLPTVYRAEEQVDQLEQRLLNDHAVDLSGDLALARGEIVRLRSAVRPNLPVTEDLQRQTFSFLKTDTHRLFADCHQTVLRLREAADEQEARVLAIHESYNTQIAQRTTASLQLLAILSVITMVFVIVTALVSLHGAIGITSQPVWYLGALVLIALLVVGIMLFLRYRKQL